MKVTGTHLLNAPREQVWDALQDPAVLARTLPGCLQLERTGANAYAVTVAAGVASIRGVYAGTVALTDHDAPSAYTLLARGQGGPGTVDATALVRLAEAEGGGTELSYEADAVVGGMIGGVGQRMLQGVARKTAAEFFAAVEADLAGERTTAPGPAVTTPATGEAALAGSSRSAAGVGEIFRGQAIPPPVAPDARLLLLSALAGAVVALLGVLVGRGLRR